MKLLKHKNNTDVAIKIIGSTVEFDTGDYLVPVLWYNIVNRNNIYQITNQIDLIKSPNLQDWDIIEYDENKRSRS